MSGVQLISIKRYEDGYYDNNGGQFGKTAVVNSKHAKKERKASEKREKKEQKEKEKQRKKLEKENSRKGKQGMTNNELVTGSNGDVIGQVNSAVSRETLEDRHEHEDIRGHDRTSLDSGLDSSQESSPINGPNNGQAPLTNHETEEEVSAGTITLQPSLVNEEGRSDIDSEDVEVVTMTESVPSKTVDNATDVDIDQQSSPLDHSSNTGVIEETITIEGAHLAEDAPSDTMLFQPTEKITEDSETNHGHVEIEISEVNDLEESPEDYQSETTYHMGGDSINDHQQGATPTTYHHYNQQSFVGNDIMVATVYEVESSSMDVDSLFHEMEKEGTSDESAKTEDDGETKRKSVRFRDYDSEDDDYASSSKDEENHPSFSHLALVDESVHCEEQAPVESSEVDWDELFKDDGEPSEKVDDDLVVTHREVIVDHRNSMRENENQPVAIQDHDKNDEFVIHREAGGHDRDVVVVHRHGGENEPDDVNEDDQQRTQGGVVHRRESLDKIESDTSTNNNRTVVHKKKKDKQKRSIFMQCCFP